MTLLVIIILPFFWGCEGPQGPQGPQGSEGPEGPVGPAGEDGSVMHSGQGAPGTDIGQNGDYYLDTDTGEMYGPKDDSGWGNPIIVLKGEDGEDGQDGQDGEDGSQIHSGSGAPDASLGAVGDYYLDEDNYDLYGPKTDSGWGSPLNLKGADGNANVTRYIYPGHDFRDEGNGGDGNRAEGCIEGISESELSENPLNYYLTYDSFGDFIMYSVPGYGNAGTTMYRAYVQHSTNTCTDGLLWRIDREDGNGEEYARIEIVRIEASNTEDNRKSKDAIIPDHLDFSDYDAVAEYYNFYTEQ